MTEHVKIIEDSDGYVTALDCHLYPDDPDKRTNAIIWENLTDYAYKITFRECPFDKNDFSVPKGQSVEVHLKPGAPHKLYTYLFLPANAKLGTEMAADPNVIVH
jgi:hypothetical protein